MAVSVDRRGADTRSVVALSTALTRLAADDLSAADFVRASLELLRGFTGADAIGLWQREHHRFVRYEVRDSPSAFVARGPLRADVVPELLDSDVDEEPSAVVGLSFGVLGASARGDGRGAAGSFWAMDLDAHSATTAQAPSPGAESWGKARGLVLIPMPDAERGTSLMKLEWWLPGRFDAADVARFESVAGLLASSLSLHASRGALRERMKEMSCLYRISQVVNRPDISVDQAMEGLVEILPAAWQHPDVAEARIELDRRVFETKGFVGVDASLSAAIERRGKRRGRVSVGYRTPRPLQDEGPFLREERTLVEGVAREIGLIVERIELQVQEHRLQEQLRHADRLSTIGQLAAGVAHELNEPLASILGYSELALKAPGLPPQVADDLDRVLRSALSARDIIRNLLSFSRQEPTRIDEIQAGDLVRDIVAFFEPRWRRKQIDLALDVVDGLPILRADAAQIRQVLVNLLVNAVQAMPEGGQLSLRVAPMDGGLRFEVADSGVGMSEETRRRAFDPFFTTKDVNEGTGLGLAVVHGIIAAHGGRIDVESAEGIGTRFVVEVPGARVVGPVAGPEEGA